jgi:hypothetical protein
VRRQRRVFCDGYHFFFLLSLSFVFLDFHRPRGAARRALLAQKRRSRARV